MVLVLKDEAVERAGIGGPIPKRATAGRKRVGKADFLDTEVQILLALWSECFFEVQEAHTGNAVSTSTRDLARDQVGRCVYIVCRGIQQDLESDFRLGLQVRERVQQERQCARNIRCCK